MLTERRTSLSEVVPSQGNLIDNARRVGTEGFEAGFERLGEVEDV